LIVNFAPDGGTGRRMFASNEGSTGIIVMPQTTLGVWRAESVWSAALPSGDEADLKNEVEGGANNFEKCGAEYVDRGVEEVCAAAGLGDTSVKPRSTNRLVTRIAPLQSS